MKLKSILGIIISIIVVFTYTAYSPALAYQPSNGNTYEAKEGQSKTSHGQHQDKDSDQNKHKKKDQQNEDQNKNDKDHKDENKNHHGNHDHDQNHQHKNDDDQDKVGGIILLFGALLFQEIHERSDARHVLQRTALILDRAQELGRQDNNENYRHYGLGRAFSHQMRARELFGSGQYQESTFHSLRARRIALNYIQHVEECQDNWDEGDDGYWQDDADEGYEMDRNEFDEIEISYWERCPSESTLSIGLEKWFVSDDDALSIRIELNLD